MSNNNNNEHHSNSHFITNKTHLQCPSWLRIRVFHGRPHLAAHETQVPGWNKSPGFGRPTNAAFSMAAVVRFCLQRFSNIGTIKKIRHSMIDHLITSQEKHMFFSLSIKYLPPQKKSRTTEERRHPSCCARCSSWGCEWSSTAMPPLASFLKASRNARWPGEVSPEEFWQKNTTLW